MAVVEYQDQYKIGVAKAARKIGYYKLGDRILKGLTTIVRSNTVDFDECASTAKKSLNQIEPSIIDDTLEQIEKILKGEGLISSEKGSIYSVWTDGGQLPKRTTGAKRVYKFNNPDVLFAVINAMENISY